MHRWDRELARSLPDYAILEELGKGPKTTVYRVRRHGVEYALKLLRHPIRDDNDKMVAFRREAALLACVSHPRLPQIHEVGQTRGRPYLVMDLVEGQKLSNILASKRLTEQATITLALDITGALSAVHRAGLVHRDVKPDNIIVNPQGLAWLVDFEFVTRQATTVGEAVAGTLLYSAPEQSGVLNRPIDGRSDLYSLGAVLFECLTGAPPFNPRDIGELLRAHATSTPPDPRSLAPDISERLSSIIQKLLAKDPDDRYQHSCGLLTDLRLLMDDAPTATFQLAGGDGSSTWTAQTPFIGRSYELDQLHKRWHRTQGGCGGAIVVIGPGGIGKTRLVTEFAVSIHAAQGVFLHGRCASTDPAPFAPLRNAVRDYVRRIKQLPQPARSAALGRLGTAAAPFAALLTIALPSLHCVSDAAQPTDEGQQNQVVTAVAAFFASLARLEQGLILHLDDGHQSDQATLGVLQRLAPDLAGTPLLVLVTMRDDLASATGCAALRAALADQVEIDLVVDRLTTTEVSRLLSAYLPGAEIDPKRLAARSDGNPFVLLEYLRLIVDLGLLRPSWGTWLLDLDALNRLDLPGSAFELVRLRVAALSVTTGGSYRTPRSSETCSLAISSPTCLAAPRTKS